MTKNLDPPTLRLTTLDQTEALRASPSDPAVLLFAQAMLDDGYIYEIPAHEWVGPRGQRGRLCWMPDWSDIWLQGPSPDRTVWRSLSGNAAPLGGKIDNRGGAAEINGCPVIRRDGDISMICHPIGWMIYRGFRLATLKTERGAHRRFDREVARRDAEHGRPTEPCCAGYERLPSVNGAEVESHSIDCLTLPPVGLD